MQHSSSGQQLHHFGVRPVENAMFPQTADYHEGIKVSRLFQVPLHGRQNAQAKRNILALFHEALWMGDTLTLTPEPKSIAQLWEQ
jgi:hypothetical protein